MDKNEVFLEVLKLLEIDDITFNNSLIQGIFYDNMLYLIVNVLTFVCFFLICYKINTTIHLWTIVNSVFSFLNGKKPKKTIHTETVEPILSEEVSTFSDVIHYIKYIIFKNGLYPIWTYILTIFIIMFEFDFGFSIFYKLFDNIVNIINCYYVPEKMLLDYLGSLF